MLKNALENLQLIARNIRKDIVKVVATETTNAIINELGDALFAILVDESYDISIKEQMAIALQFVDKRGCVI